MLRLASLVVQAEMAERVPAVLRALEGADPVAIRRKFTSTPHFPWAHSLKSQWAPEVLPDLKV
jgi:hypothetical protein